MYTVRCNNVPWNDAQPWRNDVVVGVLLALQKGAEERGDWGACYTATLQGTEVVYRYTNEGRGLLPAELAVMLQVKSDEAARRERIFAADAARFAATV